MIKYVLGFAFTESKQMVVLIEKQKPEWQKGKFNGVGGKVEESDPDPMYAMTREFQEETGVLIHTWDHFADMVFENDIMGGGAIVHCFRTFTNQVIECKTIEQEKIVIIHSDELNKYPVIKNLLILIPMAMDNDFQFAKINVL